MIKNNPSILIAGYEIGGQMQLLAETIRRRGFKATSAAFNTDFRGYQNDIMFPYKGLKYHVKRFLFFMKAIHEYNIFHFFWGVSLLSIWRFHLLDLPLLKLLNKKIVVHFRGLDVVDIKYFDYLRNNAQGLNAQEPPISRPDQKKKLKKWLKYADTVLVSEPDLHFVSTDSILSPQVIDINLWKPNKQPLSTKDGIIRIVHVPTSRRKKGTEFLEEAVEKLNQKGYKIELVLGENLNHEKIKELYEMSDIGFDQILYGWHGKVSVELMAMGKPVICYINPQYLKYRPDLPVINANIHNLIEVLEDLILNEQKREVIVAKSVNYVNKYHDVEKVVDNLLFIYGIINNNK